MSPYLGTAFGYPIPIFALTLDTGVLLGVFLAARLVACRNVPWQAFIDVALWALAAALIGARLGYALLHWHEFTDNLLTVLAVWEGGLSLLGAITLGAPAAILAARVHHVPVGPTLDAAAVGLALAQAVGRLGCLAAGCAAGTPVTSGASAALLLSMELPDAAGVYAARFPSPLVEALAEGALCLLLFQVWRRTARLSDAGKVACAYLGLYGALRLLAEPLRADSTFVGPFAVASIWSVLAIVVASVAGGWLLYRSRSERQPRGSPPTPARVTQPAGHHVSHT